MRLGLTWTNRPLSDTATRHRAKRDAARPRLRQVQTQRLNPSNKGPSQIRFPTRSRQVKTLPPLARFRVILRGSAGRRCFHYTVYYTGMIKAQGAATVVSSGALRPCRLIAVIMPFETIAETSLPHRQVGSAVKLAPRERRCSPLSQATACFRGRPPLRPLRRAAARFAGECALPPRRPISLIHCRLPKVPLNRLARPWSTSGVFQCSVDPGPRISIFAKSAAAADCRPCISVMDQNRAPNAGADKPPRR